jgi:polyphosphate kinase 2 (PPK2 family)
VKNEPIRLSRRKLRLEQLDMRRELPSKSAYEHRLDKLQLRMLTIQRTYHQQGRRAVIVTEGWDASGKGGAIKRMTEKIDPRGVKVWPIGPPTPEEQGRHYLYRFWMKLPEPGALAIFDRSWYGRVLVERVEGFARPSEWKRAYREINEFERMLLDDGVRLVKLFLHITRDEQRRRFQERLRNPYKRWKISLDDLRNRARWRDYQRAVEDMFARTSTLAAPWNAIPANAKWYARIKVLELVTDELARGVDLSLPKLDPRLRRQARREGLTVPRSR